MHFRLVAAAVAAAALSLAPAAGAQQFVNVLTGGTSGVYYPLGVAIGKIFSDKLPDVKTQVQATKASVENLILLQQGRGEEAFALGDSLTAASRRWATSRAKACRSARRNPAPNSTRARSWLRQV